MQLNDLQFQDIQSATLANAIIHIYVGDTLAEARYLAEGSELGSLSNIDAPEGYTITGWKDADGNAVTASTEIEGDLDVFAIMTSGTDIVKAMYAKMETEQPALYEAIVAHYSPNLQGLTNAQLYATDKEYTNGLRDLSGNNNHMTLYGFGGVEGEGHVDGDGNLVFDGNDDWGKSANMIQLNREDGVCVMAKLVNNTYKTASRYWHIYSGVVYVRSNQQYYGTFGGSGGFNFFYDKNATYRQYEDTLVINSNSYKTASAKGNVDESGNYLYFGHNGTSLQSPQCGYVHWLLFNRTLSENEMKWVEDNMYVTQEVTKHKVTLWHEGTKLGVLNVQNGNTIDTDSLHYEFGNQCSLYWYTDADCSELYDGQAVTEDMNLYCDSQMLYEYMLEQLDEVELSDGTSARESLMCLYSPFLQGATDASLRATPTINDLSDNGADITLYNLHNEQLIQDGGLYFNGVNSGCMYGKPTKAIGEYGCLILSFEYENKGGSEWGCLLKTQNGYVVFGNSATYIRLVQTNATQMLPTSYMDGYVAINTDTIVTDNYSVALTPNMPSGLTLLGCASANGYAFKGKLKQICAFTPKLTMPELNQILTILKLQ